VSLANDHKDIGFGRRHGDGPCVTRGVDSEMGNFDNISQGNGIYTYFVICLLLHDFSEQIVRHDYSSVCLQESYRPCECSRLNIMLNFKQQTEYGVACDG
jgi:hypothetical protein